MTRFADLLRRFRRDDRGVFMILFAVLAIVLIATSGAVVDFTKVQQARTRAQTALDAGTLALQSRILLDTDDEIKVKMQTILTQRLDDSTIAAVVTAATTSDDAGRLNVRAYVEVPTFFVRLVGIASIRANLESEATRSSSDLEVSVSLDVTGSMVATYDRRGNLVTNKIGDLISATNQLIDLVVNTQQPPVALTYSKMAIVPWSAGVNVGSTYAASVRGTPNSTTKTISGASWATGSQFTITGITQANNGVVTTSANHGFQTGDVVAITGVSGMTDVNGRSYVITRNSNTTFSLNIRTSNYSSFRSGGTPRVAKCLYSDCRVTVTANSHGYANDDPIYVDNVSGMTGLNNAGYFVANATTNSLSLVGSFGPTAGTYTSGGRIWCGSYGCSYRTFYNADGGISAHAVSTCTSERDTNTFTDTAPSTTALGYNYPSGSNGCLATQILPLTSDRATLHAKVNALVAEGSTAGHLGLAWGWYMISPNFAYLWPTDSKPRAYGAEHLIKAVIFMTDGVFNTPYCSGVIAADATSGSGGASTHINCNATNGASRAQAEQLCDAIKTPANKTLLYTVGFDLAADESSLNFLRDCATSPEYFFQADNGADLTIAFQSIASSLSELRISK
jgi:Flp pilus assembly protein TadG